MAHLVSRLAVIACVVLAPPLGTPIAAQDPAGPWTLADVRIQGLSRYAAPDVVRLSGLSPGASITLDDVREAANRLMTTGLFRQLGFGYSVRADTLTLTLKVEEPVWNVPLVFDNIIWMSDDEMRAELAKHVPAFDGTTIEGGAANAFIATAAEQVLASRGIRGRVEVQPRLELRSGSTTYTLAVRDTGTSLRVCDLRLPGANAINERTLLELGEHFTGQEYSKAALVSFSNDTLRQLYRERGHWAAAFQPPAASPVTGRCDGLSVSMAVTEGVAYRFAGARWVGVSRVDPATLNDTLDLRIGAVADVRRLDAGLEAVVRLYHQRGYLTAARTVRPEFDDATGRVTFAIDVREGPQFRMGSFSTTGLTDRQARDITSRWRIKAGDVFDGVYYRDFVARETERLGGALRAEAPFDAKAATVNVTLSGL
jgi:outer membrane protein assembly factor BamA